MSKDTFIDSVMADTSLDKNQKHAIISQFVKGQVATTPAIQNQTVTAPSDEMSQMLGLPAPQPAIPHPANLPAWLLPSTPKQAFVKSIINDEALEPEEKAKIIKTLVNEKSDKEKVDKMLEPLVKAQNNAEKKADAMYDLMEPVSNQIIKNEPIQITPTSAPVTQTPTVPTSPAPTVPVTNIPTVPSIAPPRPLSDFYAPIQPNFDVNSIFPIQTRFVNIPGSSIPIDADLVYSGGVASQQFKSPITRLQQLSAQQYPQTTLGNLVNYLNYVRS